MLHPANHPANHIETLLAYADGTLPPDKAAEVEAHLTTHAVEAQLVAQYRLIKQRVSSDDSVEPSLTAIARARAIFNPALLPARERTGWLAAVERFIATCVFDSRVEALAVRSAAAEQLVNLSYRAPGVDIDLQAERLDPPAFNGGEARWQILGQINSSVAARPARIAITSSGSIMALAECSADEYGSFSIQMPPGRYDLHVQLSNGVVVLPDLDMT